MMSGLLQMSAFVLTADFLSLFSICPMDRMHGTDRLSNHFGVCEQIVYRMITSAILYRFLQNFARVSEMWSGRCLLYARQTGSRYLI